MDFTFFGHFVRAHGSIPAWGVSSEGKSRIFFFHCSPYRRLAFFAKRTVTYTKTVYYCKTHTYLILLNRQRIEKHSVFTQGSLTHDPTLSFRAINTTPTSQASPSASTKAPLRGRPLVLFSSEEVITAFMFFYFRGPAALIDWTLCQQAFNSCMLLLYDALETRRITTGVRKVEQVFVVFQELQDNGVHELASQAVARISGGLAELHKIVACSSTGNTTPSRQQQLHISTREAKQNEAAYYSDSMDAVMGSTGMTLLEDPGLQSFVHEAYAPITWVSPEPADSFLQERGHQSPKSTSPMKEKITNDELHVVRSPGAVQSNRRSTTARSARGPCMNSSLGKPQSYTTPASATELAMAHQHAYEGDSRHLHLKHQRQPSREQRPGNPIQQCDAQVHDTRSAVVDHQQPFQHIQLRNSSCPTIANEAVCPPPMRPAYSSPNIPVATQSSYHTTTHVLPPASHGSDRSAFTAPFEGTSNHMGYPFANHISLAAPSTLTPLTEDLSMEDLRHFVGSAGTG